MLLKHGQTITGDCYYNNSSTNRELKAKHRKYGIWYHKVIYQRLKSANLGKNKNYANYAQKDVLSHLIYSSHLTFSD